MPSCALYIRSANHRPGYHPRHVQHLEINLATISRKSYANQLRIIHEIDSSGARRTLNDSVEFPLEIKISAEIKGPTTPDDDAGDLWRGPRFQR
jgi:hypothetical protein